MSAVTEADLADGDDRDKVFRGELAMYADPDYWSDLRAQGHPPTDDPGLHGRDPYEVAAELAQSLIDVLNWQFTLMSDDEPETIGYRA